MLRKIVTSIILILVIALIAQYYNVHQGSIIILTQQSKITINLAMGIILSIISFLVLYYCLRLIALIRTSPRNWRKYRQQKSLLKYRDTINKALIHFIQDEYSQAEALFKQNYLAQTEEHKLDLLMAVYTEIKAKQIPQAQNDLSEVITTDTNIKAAGNYLQTKIYQEKNQPKSAINTIKQDKHYLKKPLLLEKLCHSLLNSGQYHELIALLNQRSSMSYDDKRVWTIRAHKACIDDFMSKNQIPEACAYIKQLTSHIMKEPTIISRHIQALILQNDYTTAAKQIEKQFSGLMTSTYHHSIINLIDATSQKDILITIEQCLDNIINQTTTDKQYAYLCHAHLMIKKQLYEKAIANYQALINLNLSAQQSIDARLKIHQLEKIIKHNKSD